MRFIRELLKGLWKENPIFRLVLGMCPALAVTTSLENGIGMGIAATFVLVCSNVVIASVRSAIPAKVRIPCFIVIIATFVTVRDSRTGPPGPMAQETPAGTNANLRTVSFTSRKGRP